MASFSGASGEGDEAPSRDDRALLASPAPSSRVPAPPAPAAAPASLLRAGVDACTDLCLCEGAWWWCTSPGTDLACRSVVWTLLLATVYSSLFPLLPGKEAATAVPDTFD